MRLKELYNTELVYVHHRLKVLDPSQGHSEKVTTFLEVRPTQFFLEQCDNFAEKFFLGKVFGLERPQIFNVFQGQIMYCLGVVFMSLEVLELEHLVALLHRESLNLV